MLRVEAGWHVSVVLCADEAASCRSLARSPLPSLATQCYVLHDACLQHCSLTSPRLTSQAAAAERGYRYFYCKTYFERSKYLAGKM